ncbi:MAG: hypothetical protein ACK56I_35305, partial [bacterium]
GGGGGGAIPEPPPSCGGGGASPEPASMGIRGAPIMSPPIGLVEQRPDQSPVGQHTHASGASGTAPSVGLTTAPQPAAVEPSAPARARARAKRRK